MDYEAECGCEYLDFHDTPMMKFCSLHNAAQMLKDTVEFALGCVDGTKRDYAGELIGRLQLASDFADGIGHASDCDLHSEPAYPVSPCSCGMRAKTL